MVSIIRRCCAAAFLLIVPTTVWTSQDRVRFTAAATQEWRIEVVDGQDTRVFDSGWTFGTTLEWPLIDAQGSAVADGTYRYTLTTRIAQDTQIRHGDVHVAHTLTGTQISVTTDAESAAAGLVPQIVDAGEASTPASQNSTPRPTGSQASNDAQAAGAGDTFRRNLGPASFSPQIAGTGTSGRMTRWIDGPNGVVGDTNVSEQNGSVIIGNSSGIGRLQIFGFAGDDVFAGMGPDLVNGPAFNFGYAASSFGRGAGFFNVRPDALATGVNPSLRFLTANLQRMIVTKDGNVGIGTGDPVARLQVAGDASSQGISATGGTAVFGLSTANDGIGVYGSSVNGEGVRALSSGGKALNAVTNGSGWSGYFSGRVTVQGNLGLGVDAPDAPLHVAGTAHFGGNVGIGTGSPDAALHVAGGNAHFGGTVGIGIASPARALDVAGLFRVQNGAFGVEMKSAGEFVPVTDALQNVGEPAHRWNTVFATNGTIQTSDARLKDRVDDLGGGLTTVMQLRPVTFEWKDRRDNRRHLGLLAQEVEPLIPEVIYRDVNPEAPLGMNYAELVPLVIKSIQEQESRIKSLEAQIAILEDALRQLSKSQPMPATTIKSGGDKR